MTKRALTDIPASVRQRLLNLAKTRGEEPQKVLGRYGIERFLYRLSRSDYRDKFVLKGALLFYVWEGELHRPTRDLDFLARGDPSPDGMLAALSRVCVTDVEEDGLLFLPDSIRIQPIRERNRYAGLRISLLAMLGVARIPLRIDFGFGDAITPEPDLLAFPTLLNSRAPKVRMYPPETVVAEKYQSMVLLGAVNTRMKDFYDVVSLSRTHAFEGSTLASALANTFTRRRTPLPPELPIALTPAFGRDPAKIRDWDSFLSRIAASDAPAELSQVITEVAAFLWPISEAARTGRDLRQVWLPAVGWAA